MLPKSAQSNKERAGERGSSLPKFSGGSPLQARDYRSRGHYRTAPTESNGDMRTLI